MRRRPVYSDLRVPVFIARERNGMWLHNHYVRVSQTLKVSDSSSRVRAGVPNRVGAVGEH
jgi:hypothetical protein